MKFSLLILAAELVSAVPQYSLRRSPVYSEGALNSRNLFVRDTVRHHLRELNGLLDDGRLFERARTPKALAKPAVPAAASGKSYQVPVASKKPAVSIPPPNKGQSSRPLSQSTASITKGLNTASGGNPSSIPDQPTAHDLATYTKKATIFREMITSPDGKIQWSRKLKPPNGQWELKGPSEEEEKENEYFLAVVRQKQSNEEPDHWSLFVYQEGKRGTVYQVKGDATAMRHFHAENIDLLHSGSIKDHFDIAKLGTDTDGRKRNLIKRRANEEPAPHAETLHDVTANCQGWTIRVVRHLIDDGIVERKWYNELLQKQQPLQR